MKDYRVKITIRNDRLLSAIEDQDYPSVAQICAATSLDYQRITEIIRGKLKPLNQKGEPIPLVCNLLDILNISLEDAFTERQLQGFHKTSKKSRRNKFRSLLIEKNFEPARNLTLEELTEETCKYMEHDMHPNDPHATFCGRKTISNSKQKFSYCPLHLMIIFQPKSKKEDVGNKDDEVPQFIEKKIKSA